MRRDSEHQGATSFHVRTTGMPLIVVDGQRHRVTGGNGRIGEPSTDGTPVLRGLCVPMGPRPQLPGEADTYNPASAAKIVATVATQAAAAADKIAHVATLAAHAATLTQAQPTRVRPIGSSQQASRNR